jgi:hypothetical protein
MRSVKVERLLKLRVTQYAIAFMPLSTMLIPRDSNTVNMKGNTRGQPLTVHEGIRELFRTSNMDLSSQELKTLI